MFINTNTNEIFFRLELLDNINNDLYKIIIQENTNIRKKSNLSNKNIHNVLQHIRKNSSKTNLIHKEKDRDKDKNKTKYKSNNLEISLLDCTIKKINISAIKIESKYYKIPDRLLNCIFNIKDEKDLFNNNFNDISKIGKCIGECSYDIIKATEENIINEEQIMKKKVQDISINKSVTKSMEKYQTEKISNLTINNKNVQNPFNRLKTIKNNKKELTQKILKKKEEK